MKKQNAFHFHVIVGDDERTMVVLADHGNNGAKVRDKYTNLGDLVQEARAEYEERQKEFAAEKQRYAGYDKLAGGINADVIQSSTTPVNPTDEFPF